LSGGSESEDNVSIGSLDSRNSLTGVHRLKVATLKVIELKKRKKARMRIILPVGDEDGEEALFWENLGSPRKIPGAAEQGGGGSNASSSSSSSSKKPWWEADNEPSQSKARRPTRNNKKGGGVEETMADIRQKIRTNEEMGYHAGLLRKPDCVNEDPNEWMRHARAVRTLARKGGGGGDDDDDDDEKKVDCPLPLISTCCHHQNHYHHHHTLPFSRVVFFVFNSAHA
jgi:hypothetical protein